MNDRDFTKLAFILGGAFVLYWYYERRKAAMQEMQGPQAPALPIDGNTGDPITDVYASNPAASDPASLGDINITITNQGLGYLTNQYIPLFGFVGMAQGVFYQ